jgi:two-component system, OmpR family, sensor kinase
LSGRSTLRSLRLISVRNRLLVLFFVITAAAVGFVYLYVVPQLESSLTAQKLSRLEERGSGEVPQLRRALRRALPEAELESLVRRIAQATDARLTILGIRTGADEAAPSFVIGDSQLESTAIAPRYDVATAAISGRTAAGVESIGGSRSAEVAIPFPPADPVWIAVFSEPLAEVDDSVSLIRRQILIAGGIALLLALVAGLWAARAISLKLRRLEAAAKKVAAGDFASPIPIDSSDELGDLARTFNEMQRRLASLDSARRQFVANASHELRTPIFSLGGFVELLEDEDPDPAARAEFVRTMREQIERLRKLTTDLLDLSRLDADAMEIRARDVDLAELTREVAREFGPAATNHRSRLEVRTAPAGAVAHADPDRVRQIIRILLDNALTHTPEGTKVTVTTVRESGRAQLIVSDEGRGIGARIQKRIFERFFTGGDASGSGLGLAIGRELAVRMGGGLRVTSTKEFTAFTLDLPPGVVRELTGPLASGARS